MTRDFFNGQMERNLDAIENLGVKRTEARYFIPPYEWYNEEGLVEAIEYYQVSGEPISQKQMNQLTEANGVKVSHWNKLTSDAAGNIWLSDDHAWRAELSWDGTMGAKPMQRYLLSTPKGFLGMNAALGPASQPENNNNTPTDLPVAL